LYTPGAFGSTLYIRYRKNTGKTDNFRFRAKINISAVPMTGQAQLTGSFMKHKTTANF
jgi:hypothetical protein